MHCTLMVSVQASPQQRIILPAARNVNAPGGLSGLRKLIDVPMRDTNICLAADGNYYMTGTTDPADGKASMWDRNDGIPLWKSADMVHWQSLGLVWKLDRDAAWAKEWKPIGGQGEPKRAVWAPEIHNFNGTFWIPYSMNYRGIGVLKSMTGKPEGPYVDVKPSGPLAEGIDASLFQDDDGKIYLLHDSFNIARMKPDMSDLAEPDRKVTFTDGKYGWGEGVFMVKDHGRYTFINTLDPKWNSDGKLPDTYDNASAVSAGSIYGPYTPRKRAIVHDGHNNLFKDKQGNWWSTYFGSGPAGPWGIQAGVLPVELTAEGRLTVKHDQPRPQWQYTTMQPNGAWTTVEYNAAGWKTSPGAFGDPAVSEFGQFTDIGTSWKTPDIWLRKSWTLKAAPTGSPQLYLRHSGPIEISLNGKIIAKLAGSTADYIEYPISGAGALRDGNNVIAVHCSSAELNYVDVGIVATPGVVTPTSESAGQTWLWKTDDPGAGWEKPDFDETGWQSGTGLFGNGVPGIGTPWTTSDIWLRRGFTVTAKPNRPSLRIFHDEDVEVYIDGIRAVSLSGFKTAYDNVAIEPAAAERLTPGYHLLAVHCKQTTGGQGVDAGIIDASVK